MKHFSALILLPFFILLDFHDALSQTYNTLPGFIVTNEGDTISGLIKDKVNIYDVVSFQSTSKSEFIDYYPSNIRGFSFQNGFNFESAILDNGTQVFLLYVLPGRLALYQWYETLFVKLPDGTLRLLQHEEDKVTDRKVIEDKRYIRTLLYLTSDCPNVKNQIERLRYTASDISKVLEEYNKCINPAYEGSVYAITKLEFHVGARVGTSISRFKYLSGDSPFYGVDFSSNARGLAGMFFNISYKNKLSVQPEIILSKKEAYALGKLSIFADEHEFVVSSTFLEFPFSVYYTFPTQGLRPFISIGGLAGFAISQESKRIANGSNLSMDVSRDVLGYRGGIGFSKSISERYLLGLEYSISHSFGNRNYLFQNYSWLSHEITFRTAFDIQRRKK